MSHASIEDKIKAHLWVGRKLTNEEWTTVCAVDKSLRFKRGDTVQGRRVSGYSRSSKDGLFLLGEEEYQAEHNRRIEYRKKYVAEHRDAVTTWHKAYYRRNREGLIHMERTRYAQCDKAAHRAQNKRWTTNNPDKVKAINRRKYLKVRADPRRRTMQTLRRRLNMAVDAKLLYGRAQDRASVDFLLWLATYQSLDPSTHHIDHILPLSRCDLSTPERQQWANSPDNVRWLTAEANLARGDTLPTTQEVKEHLVLVALWKASNPNMDKVLMRAGAKSSSPHIVTIG